jgi:hypothetical protein
MEDYFWLLNTGKKRTPYDRQSPFRGKWYFAFGSIVRVFLKITAKGVPIREIHWPNNGSTALYLALAAFSVS